MVELAATYRSNYYSNDNHVTQDHNSKKAKIRRLNLFL